MTLYYRYSIIFLLTVACLLFTISYQKRPIGYLHSWNQVTTLVHISEISSNIKAFDKPFDIVTRVSAHPTPKKLEISFPYEDFRRYEEFPLYHLASALLIRTGMAPENGARIVSILSFIFAGIGLFLLASRIYEERAGFFSVLCWGVSFPVLYYGQAAMSDMSMTAAAIWSCYFLSVYNTKQNLKPALYGLAFAALSSLFKSYGLITLIPWFALLVSRAEFVKALLLCSTFALPVLSWHGLTLSQEGQQEIFTHSVQAKLNFILSLDFLLLMQKYYFRYLPYVPGLVLLIYFFWLCAQRNKSKMKSSNTLLYSLVASTILYLVFCADKLTDHDYYILLIAPGLFLLAGNALNEFWKYLHTHQKIKALVPVFIMLALAQLPLSYKSLTKALIENSDISTCAELIDTSIPKEALVGYLGDSARYNSLAYYGKRFGLIIEGQAFPLSRYLPYGISYLVVNTTDEEFAGIESWINTQRDVKNVPVLVKKELPDFKSRSRTCAIYGVSS